MPFTYKGMEVWADPYVPMYSAADKWTMRKWRWFLRFIGRPHPRGERQFFVMKLPFEDRSVVMMNPELYAEVERELTTVRN